MFAMRLIVRKIFHTSPYLERSSVCRVCCMLRVKMKGCHYNYKNLVLHLHVSTDPNFVFVDPISIYCANSILILWLKGH